MYEYDLNDPQERELYALSSALRCWRVCMDDNHMWLKDIGTYTQAADRHKRIVCELREEMNK